MTSREGEDHLGGGNTHILDSQYEVFNSIYLNFACIDRVVIGLVEEEVAPRNAASLLRMIQDPASLWSLKIELSALLEGLDAISKFTYIMECDGELAFKAGTSVDALIALYPDGKVCTLPSDNHLIEQHL
jgi:hypothetical protein